MNDEMIKEDKKLFLAGNVNVDIRPDLINFSI